MDSCIKDIRYVLMPSRHPVRGYENIYAEAYSVWRSAWEKFRLEIGIKDPLNSDAFILPDEMGVLLYKNRVVGLAAFTHGDLSSGTMPDQAWFKAWTPEAFNQLKNISPDCIICSQFTVGPEFTGRGHVVRWKEILFYYNHLRLINSQKDIMAGHLNLTRGMQNAGGEEFGGIVLDPNHPFSFSGVQLNSQLVAYTRESIQQMVERKNISPLFNQLWSQLENVSDFPVTQTQVIQLKKAA